MVEQENGRRANFSTIDNALPFRFFSLKHSLKLVLLLSAFIMTSCESDKKLVGEKNEERQDEKLDKNDDGKKTKENPGKGETLDKNNSDPDNHTEAQEPTKNEKNKIVSSKDKTRKEKNSVSAESSEDKNQTREKSQNDKQGTKDSPAVIAETDKIGSSQQESGENVQKHSEADLLRLPSPNSLLEAVEGVCKSDVIREQIDKTIPVGLENRERNHLIKERRMDLRFELKKSYANRAIEIESKLAPYLALAGIRASSQPAQCNYFKKNSFGTEYDLKHKAVSNKIRRFKGVEKLFKGSDGTDGIYGLLSQVAYELVLIDFIIKDEWKSNEMLPEGVDAFVKPFPPIYPLNLNDSLDKRIRPAFPQDRFDYLANEYAVLNRPIRSNWGTREEPLSFSIFRDVFLNDQKNIRSQMTNDLRVPIQRLFFEYNKIDKHKLFELIRDENFLLPDEVEHSRISVHYSRKQRIYLLAWQKFLRDEVLFHIAENFSEKFEVKSTNTKLKAKIILVVKNWHRELRGANHKLCKNEDHSIEDDPFAMALFLSQKSSQRSGKNIYEHLSAFCDKSWGYHRGTVTNNILKVGGYVAIGAGLVLAPYAVGPAMVGVAVKASAVTGGTLIAGSYLQKTIKNFETLNLNSALYAPTIAERNLMRAGTAYNAAMIPASIIASGVVADKMVASKVLGLKVLYPNLKTPLDYAAYFIPMGMGLSISAKKFMDNGKNPLKSPSFIIDALGTHFMWALTTQGLFNVATESVKTKLIVDAKTTAAAIFAYFVIDDAIQGGKFLVVKDRPSSRFGHFILSHTPSVSANVMVMSASRHLIERVMGRGHVAAMASIWTWKVIQSYLYYNFSYAMMSRYMTHKNKTYWWDLIKSLRVEDFKVWVDNNICSQPATEEDKVACDNLKKDYFPGLGLEDRQNKLQNKFSLSEVQRFMTEDQPFQEDHFEAFMRQRAEAQKLILQQLGQLERQNQVEKEK